MELSAHVFIFQAPPHVNQTPPTYLFASRLHFAKLLTVDVETASAQEVFQHSFTLSPAVDFHLIGKKYISNNNEVCL